MGRSGEWGGAAREGGKAPPQAEPDMEPICFKRKLMGRASRGEGTGRGRAGPGEKGEEPAEPILSRFIETHRYGERLRVWAGGDPAPGRGERCVDMGRSVQRITTSLR